MSPVHSIRENTTAERPDVSLGWVLWPTPAPNNVNTELVAREHMPDSTVFLGPSKIVVITETSS